MSRELGLTVNQILSATGSLSDEDHKRAHALKDKLSNYNIYFIDIPSGVSQIFAKVMEFHKRFPDYNIVNVFDHSRLVTDENERDEMAKIGRMSKMCMFLKKKIKCSNIILSQLNRNIESAERAKSKYEPLLSDIFSADSLAQDADSVIIMQRPEMYRIANYNGYDTKGLLAIHVMKNRDGDTGWLPFKHNLGINLIEEFTITDNENKESNKESNEESNKNNSQVGQVDV